MVTAARCIESNLQDINWQLVILRCLADLCCSLMALSTLEVLIGLEVEDDERSLASRLELRLIFEELVQIQVVLVQVDQELHQLTMVGLMLREELLDGGVDFQFSFMVAGDRGWFVSFLDFNTLVTRRCLVWFIARSYLENLSDAEVNTIGWCTMDTEVMELGRLTSVHAGHNCPELMDNY